MIKPIKIILAFMLVSGLFVSCKKEGETAEVVSPKEENVEIGYANNKQAIRGRDFHFNADILAGDKIESVQVKILPKAGLTYSSPWKMEIAWDEFKGLKNANVHKHFTIPSEAPEGKFDFFFVVNDVNGSKLELKEDFQIFDAANMPVDPIVDRDIFSRNDDMVYYMNTYVENPLVFKKGDKFTARAQIKQIQGDGILYTALIKRTLNHFPETVDKLDLTKAIIISKVEHKDLGLASKVNTYKLVNGAISGDDILIGAEKDGLGSQIYGERQWQSGQYNLVILYKNTTFNMSTFKSIPITISY
ncbi:DUF4625 domain-containing protein [Sphingobacterium paramultivorum]|uniref:DUF4625 domain-containing protein n=1 Tax=Sphingobacterium paramultivorum TaxID=2886510 RepID=UPI00129CF339|nr:DUF4625 domain-containing protein [Sphingobacterium paramultivorum]